MTLKGSNCTKNADKKQNFWLLKIKVLHDAIEETFFV